MTVFLLKTIQSTGACASLIQRMLFKDTSLVYASATISPDTRPFLPAIRNEAKIALGIFFFVHILAAIILTNIVVTKEYALSAVNKVIAKEEALHAEIAAEYAAEQSSRATRDTSDIQQNEMFVRVDAVRYLAPSTIVQANATLR